MKKLKFFLPCLLLSFFVNSLAGQINQINIVSFTVKNSLPGTIDNWMSIPGALVLVAQKVPSPRMLEPRLVIQIRSNGAVLCGNTPVTARPVDPFDVRTFNTADLTGLLTNCHELKEGSYTICAQFFNVDKVAISREVCKEFRVEATNIDYSPPTLITPENGKKFTLQELERPVIFRWTPVVPKPKEPVVYRLRVWQLMQGQNGVAAMKANQPIITKDVDNLTQATVNSILTGPCMPPYLCDFIWNVQALNRDGKPIGGNNGNSESSQFSANSCDVNLTLKLISVECLTATNENYKYKICVSATYTGSIYNLTYSNAGSGFKAYHPSNSPNYPVSNLQPALQVQNSGSSTTVNYCFDISVPAGQTAIKVGLQGDDKDPGLIVCQPGAELDIRLPNCKTCDCGTWNPLIVQNAAGIVRYDCGSKVIIPWNCNQPFNFASSFQCSPNNESCQATTAWEIKKDGISIKKGSGTNSITDSFTPTANGTYIITLNATCNRIKCPPCIYTIVVKDCDIKCNCGTWNPLIVQNAAGIVKYDCGSKVIIPWNCNQPFNFASSYQCSPNNERCQATTAWEIKKDGVSIKTGSGTNSITDVFTPTANGSYTITLNATCNGIKCPPCIYTIVVKDCDIKCNCGTWNPLIVQNAAGIVKYDCGSKVIIPWNCNQPFNFASSFQCSPNNERCQATTAWEIKKDGVSIKTGSSTNSITDGFTPTANGTYIITLNATCNRIKCPPCIYTVVVKDCDIVCSPPINIYPTNNKIFTDKDLLKPIIFNWSPIISSYKGIVTYHLMVWEVEDGQTNAHAIYNNQPVLEEDVKGQTSYIVRPGIFEMRDAHYVWRVVALDEEGKPICRNSQSEPTIFSIDIPEKQEPQTLLNTPCGNGDFESGILDPLEWSAGYTKISGNNSTFSPPFNNTMQPANGNPIDAPLNTGCGNQANENHHVIVSAGFDPTIPTLNRVPPSIIANKYALRLGNNCPGFGTERIQKHFIVTPNDTVYRFMYALVFQAPHSLTDNPSLWVRVYDATNTPVTGIVYLDPLSTLPMDRAVSDPANPYWQSYNGTLYRDWACAKINLSSLVGQAITIEILTNDCAQGYHYGYGYFDNFCVGCNNNPPPTDCCSDSIKSVSNTVTVAPGDILSIAEQFNISPINIKKVTAEIISVDEEPIDTSCMTCIAKENWIYQFISHNTASWNSGLALNATPVNNTSYYPARMVEWQCNKQGNLQLTFKIALPGTANGCNRKGKICIRYGFTDINCKTCEKIICYRFG